MTADNVRDFIKGIHDLPTIPALLGRVISIANDENASQEDLYSMISHDQALAEKVVRIANSALFGHSGSVKDIRQAIMFLGLDRIKSIAIGMAVMDVFPARSSFDIKNLWIHSYEVALLAGALSDTIPMTSPRESFLSGLLHDIGRIIFYKIDHKKFMEVETTDDLLEREAVVFGCTHADAGAWFIEGTGMPSEIVMTTKFHHRPSKARDYKDAVSIVSLAEASSRRYSPKIEDDGIWTEEHDAVLLEYSLSDDDMALVAGKFIAAKKDIENFF